MHLTLSLNYKHLFYLIQIKALALLCIDSLCLNDAKLLCLVLITFVHTFHFN
jgi:hypothetical protein